MSDSIKITDSRTGKSFDAPKELAVPDNITVIDSRTKKEYF